MPPSKSYTLTKPASISFFAQDALLPPDLQYKTTGLVLSRRKISSSKVSE